MNKAQKKGAKTKIVCFNIMSTSSDNYLTTIMLRTIRRLIKNNEAVMIYKLTNISTNFRGHFMIMKSLVT